MAISLLNHSTTETAHAATHTYKTTVDELGAGLRYQSQAAGTAWEGTSYQRLLEVLEDVQRSMQAILDASGTAGTNITYGQEQALRDEREAERREAERREQEAQQAQQTEEYQVYA